MVVSHLFVTLRHRALAHLWVADGLIYEKDAFAIEANTCAFFVYQLKLKSFP